MMERQWADTDEGISPFVLVRPAGRTCLRVCEAIDRRGAKSLTSGVDQLLQVGRWKTIIYSR